MATLVFTSPTAAAAFGLLDRLREHSRAIATPGRDGSWNVEVSLVGSKPSAVPKCLSEAQEWVDEHGLIGTWVTLAGHTYLLRGSRRPDPSAPAPVPSPGSNAA